MIYVLLGYYGTGIRNAIIKDPEIKNYSHFVVRDFLGQTYNLIKILAVGPNVVLP